MNDERIRAAHHDLRIFQTVNEGWNVWIEPNDGEFDGVQIGEGGTRDAAIAKALDSLESAALKLRTTSQAEMSEFRDRHYS